MSSMSHRTGRPIGSERLSDRVGASERMDRRDHIKSVGIGSLAVIAGLSIAAWAPVAVALNAVIN
jgi:hypothetical protein